MASMRDGKQNTETNANNQAKHAQDIAPNVRSCKMFSDGFCCNNHNLNILLGALTLSGINSVIITVANGKMPQAAINIIDENVTIGIQP